MTKRNVLIIGAGGVAHVAAHKAAMHNDVLGDICIASRTLSKCDAIIESVRGMGHLQDPSGSLHARQLDAMDVAATVALIKETEFADRRQPRLGVRQHVGPRGLPGDRRRLHRHRDPRGSRRRSARTRRGTPTTSGSGATRCADAGRHGDPRRRVRPRRRQRLLPRWPSKQLLRHDRHDRHPRRQRRQPRPVLRHQLRSGDQLPRVRQGVDLDRPSSGSSTRRTPSSATCDFPVVGEQPVYLTGHDELHSLSKNIDANSIRFWMGFGDHYINVFTVLRTLGLLSHEPVQRRRRRRGRAAAGRQGRAARPADAWPPGYTGKTCIGDVVKGTQGRPAVARCSSTRCAITPRRTPRSESQAISYTAGVPPVAAARARRPGQLGRRARWSTSRSSTRCRSSSLLDQIGPADRDARARSRRPGPLRRHRPRPGRRDRRLGGPRGGLGRRPDADPAPVLTGFLNCSVRRSGSDRLTKQLRDPPLS